jgi:hypothetical protein
MVWARQEDSPENRPNVITSKAANGADPQQKYLHLASNLFEQFCFVLLGNNAFTLPPADQTGLAAITDAMNAVRAHLADQLPELGTTNKKYSFWKTVQDAAG